MIAAARTENRVIHHRCSTRRKWSTVAVFLVQLAIPLLLAALPTFHLLGTATAALTQVDTGANLRWRTEAPSASEEWSLQCERENKQAAGPQVGLFDIGTLVQQRKQQLRFAAAQISVPLTLCLPRRLSPPPTADDPLPS